MSHWTMRSKIYSVQKWVHSSKLLDVKVVRENQKLHFGKVELVDDDATLADLNILPGAHLWVMDTGQHENRDIAGMQIATCFSAYFLAWKQNELTGVLCSTRLSYLFISILLSSQVS